MSLHDENLVWIDLEMTGLDPESCVIIEIATIVTDKELNTLATGPVIAIHQSQSHFDAMDEWNTRTHYQSGLVSRCLASDQYVRDAELATLEFIQQYVVAGKSPLCGNSIGQDRRFLVKYMPELESYLSYRNLDVSSIKEVVKRWKPEILADLTKNNTHQALEDIRDSIDELRFYREHVFSI